MTSARFIALPDLCARALPDLLRIPRSPRLGGSDRTTWKRPHCKPPTWSKHDSTIETANIRTEGERATAATIRRFVAEAGASAAPAAPPRGLLCARRRANRPCSSRGGCLPRVAEPGCEAVGAQSGRKRWVDCRAIERWVDFRPEGRSQYWVHEKVLYLYSRRTQRRILLPGRSAVRPFVLAFWLYNCGVSVAQGCMRFVVVTAAEQCRRRGAICTTITCSLQVLQTESIPASVLPCCSQTSTVIFY